jgi:4-hydroxybenzoate polyprenyltransferase
MKTIINIIRSLRINHWIKNLILFIPLIFSENLFNLPLFLKTVLGFGIFSLLSSGTYIFNDIVDIGKDRMMPHQLQRPIAKGLVKLSVAKAVSAILILVSLILSFALSPSFGIISLFYCLLIIFYSIYFKNIIFVDVIIVSIGFVMRAILGALLIDVEASNWLIFCTFSLALFISTLKRRSRFYLLNNIYTGYNQEILNFMVQICASTTILSYALYVVSLKQEWKGMFITIPVAVYCIFRYLYQNLYAKHYITPERLIFTDRPLSVGIILWLSTVLLSIYA